MAVLLYAIHSIPLKNSAEIDEVMSDDPSIRRGDWGCNGPDDIHEHICRIHCEILDFRTGRCSLNSNYTICVCYD
ncbi:unnamed protein product [Adineta steineri]|uniref:Uncharacterized protein n=1 Tax=Adineta steineri TaxID=433720 RepID=A0A818L642_9BILA|nr:unnamed protein product [Adineta steineri]CAF3861911.1 unnamed protein product [Adineta steineri]CAF4029195.1 unnamed protein product [Adineta steineri]